MIGRIMNGELRDRRSVPALRLNLKSSFKVDDVAMFAHVDRESYVRRSVPAPPYGEAG